MNPDALARLSARIEALEAEKAALVRRVLRGEGDLRAADERVADGALRLQEALGHLESERAKGTALRRDQDQLRSELSTQAMLLRELPVLAARCEALEAALAANEAAEVDEASAKAALNRALAAERALRAGIEDAFSQEVLTRAELEKALAESHSARMALEESLAQERKQRIGAEVALAASGELLQAAEQRLTPPATPEPVRAIDGSDEVGTSFVIDGSDEVGTSVVIDARAFPVSEPPSSALPSTREVRAREKGLRDELTLLGARNDALVDLAHHALRALIAAVDGSLDPSLATPSRRPAADLLSERLRMLLGGVAPGHAEPRLAAAMVTSLGGTLRIDPAVGHVIVDFSRVRKSDAVAVEGDFAPEEEDAVADAYLLFVASWAASVYLASKMAQLPAGPGDAPRTFRFTPFGSSRR